MTRYTLHLKITNLEARRLIKHEECVEGLCSDMVYCDAYLTGSTGTVCFHVLDLKSISTLSELFVITVGAYFNSLKHA